MRTVTIQYDVNSAGNETIHIEDNDGQFVDVEFTDQIALILSELHGDEAPVAGSCALEDAEAQALFLMGIPSNER